MPQKTVFKDEDLARLTFSKKAWINRGKFGVVYLGRAHFKPEGAKKQVVKRVAVKVFDRRIDEEKVARYRQAIDRLVKEGISVPKTGFCQIEGKLGLNRRADDNAGKTWVQYQELYFGKAFTKMRKTMPLLHAPSSERESMEFGKLIAQFTNAGYDPYAVGDSIAKVKLANGTDHVWLVHDFDMFLPENEEMGHQTVPNTQERMNRIVYRIKHTTHPVWVPVVHKAIADHLKGEQAKQALAKAIEEIRGK